MHPNKNFPQLAQQLGYVFKDEALLTLALTHRSRKKNKSSAPGVVNYERLEFLGDAILGVAMAKYLYVKYPTHQEGHLTRMRATLVRQETLVYVAKSLELGKYLIMGAGEVKAGGRQRDSILADVVEALLGAIYLDCNDVKLMQELIMKWFEEPLVEIDKIDITARLKDSKSKLQETLQARKLTVPKYEMINIDGKAPHEIFTVECAFTDEDGKKQTTQAEGKSRRIAEQNAAKAMLDTFIDEQ